jgi:membrane-associated protease RseP (regulator of RpoE activity)
MMLVDLIVLALGTVTVLFVHELGHLIAAQCCGVPVAKIRVGFGPEIAGFTDRLATRWSFGLVLLGASCHYKLDQAQRTPGQMAGSATDRSFANASVLQRALIVSAGPIVSVILAFAIFSAVVVFGALPDWSTLTLADPVGIILLIAGLSLAIGLFNLLPLPPLDGGLLIFLLIEAMRGVAISNAHQMRMCRAGMFSLSIGGCVASLGMIISVLKYAISQ